MFLKVQDDGIDCQTTTLVASLSMKDCQFKVISVEGETKYLIPQIINSSSEQILNAITRTTTVRYLDKKYIVTDRYQFEYQLQKEEDSEVNDSSLSASHQRERHEERQIKREIKDQNKLRKVCIFQKRLANQKTLSKRNTKNLPKNFYKGFLNFILESKFNQSQTVLLKQMKGLGEGEKYNNILIQKMLSNAIISPYFKQFLQNHAETWINGSKISDKSMHIEAIPIYLSLFDKFTYAEEDNNSYYSDQ